MSTFKIELIIKISKASIEKIQVIPGSEKIELVDFSSKDEDHLPEDEIYNLEDFWILEDGE